MNARESNPFSLDAHYRNADRALLTVLWVCQLYAWALATWYPWSQALLVGVGRCWSCMACKR